MILLTGATGFLGSHVLDALTQNKKDVVIAIRENSSFKNISHIDRRLYQSFVVNGVNTDLLFKKFKIDFIVNAANSYGRDGGCLEVLESNLIFPIRLIEEGVRNGLRGFINTDSYFNKDGLGYSHLLNYSTSKKSFVTWLKYYSKKIKVANLMLEHVFGPRDGIDKFVAKLVDGIAIQQVDSIDMTYGHQRRDFVYVKDVAMAYIDILRMMENQNFGFREYEIGTGESMQIRSFAECVKSISSSPTVLNFGAIPYRDDEIMNSVGNILEIKNLGWKPLYEVKDALREMIELKNGEGCD